MRSDAQTVWDGLPAPWKVAFEEAWTSWRRGNFGIGAVLVEPSDGTIVATGRNRVTEREPTVGTISGNFLAHAEMNAFAAMPTMFARGLHLYTTLEPCLMCAATAIQLNVAHVDFAAPDEFFDGLDDVWAVHPYTTDRRPSRSGPMGGELGTFARVLPLSFTMMWMPDSRVSDHAREVVPTTAELATELPHDPVLTDLARREAPVVDALSHLWPRLR